MEPEQPAPRPHPLNRIPAQIAVLYAVAAAAIGIGWLAWGARGSGDASVRLGILMGFTGIGIGVLGYPLMNGLVRLTGARQKRLPYPWEAPGQEHLRPPGAPDQDRAWRGEERDPRVFLEPLTMAGVVLVVAFPLLLLGLVLMVF